MSYGSVYEQIAHFRTSIDLAAHTRTTTQQSTQFLAQGVWHVHWVKEPCRFMNMARNAGSQKTKLDAALDRVEKLRRREPSQLLPRRRLQLLGICCEVRDPPGLCRSHKASPARLRVMLIKILTCSHLGRSRPTSRVACVTARRVQGVGRGCACAAGAGRLPPVPRSHLVDEDVMTSLAPARCT